MHASNDPSMVEHESQRALWPCTDIGTPTHTAQLFDPACWRCLLHSSPLHDPEPARLTSARYRMTLIFHLFARCTGVVLHSVQRLRVCPIWPDPCAARNDATYQRLRSLIVSYIYIGCFCESLSHQFAECTVSTSNTLVIAMQYPPDT